MPRGPSLEVRKYSYDTRAMERAKSQYVTELVGGEASIAKALALSDDPNVQKFLRALTKRKKEGSSIYAVAVKYGITLTQMVDIIREGYYSGILNEMFRAGTLTAQATIRDAQPSFSVCPQCDGRKTVVFPARYSAADTMGNKHLLEDEWVGTCPNCCGDGKVRQAGSAKAQEMIFRATKVLEEKQLNINVNQNNFSGVDSVIDDLDSRRSKRPRTIEVEPCQPEPD